MSFHSKQKRVPLRLQTIFKNIRITYQSELWLLKTYITENTEWGTNDENRNNVLLYDKYLNLESCLTYGVLLWGGDNKSNNIFKLQKKSFKYLLVSVMPFRQIFEDYNTLTLSSFYIIEMF
jgi:hypothetical protein